MSLTRGTVHAVIMDGGLTYGEYTAAPDSSSVSRLYNSRGEAMVYQEYELDIREWQNGPYLVNDEIQCEADWSWDKGNTWESGKVSNMMGVCNFGGYFPENAEYLLVRLDGTIYHFPIEKGKTEQKPTGTMSINELADISADGSSADVVIRNTGETEIFGLNASLSGENAQQMDISFGEEIKSRGIDMLSSTKRYGRALAPGEEAVLHISLKDGVPEGEFNAGLHITVGFGGSGIELDSADIKMVKKSKENADDNGGKTDDKDKGQSDKNKGQSDKKKDGDTNINITLQKGDKTSNSFGADTGDEALPFANAAALFVSAAVLVSAANYVRRRKRKNS